MNIAIRTNKKYYETDKEIAHECISGNVVLDEILILAAGEINPQGEEVLISGVDYVINNKRYDLSTGYAIKAVLCDGFIIPKLRRATMSERYAFVRRISEPHKEEQVLGEVVEFWPDVKKIWDNK